VCPAAQGAGGAPLLFVHGAFCGAWCWEEHFLSYFAERGHDAWAVDLRGHGGDGEGADSVSVEDYVGDVLAAVERIGRPPVLLGHSMGAIVVQRAWRRAHARALALLAPVPLQGLFSSGMMLALKFPEMFIEINKLQLCMGLPATSARLRQAIFSEDLPLAEGQRHLRRMRRESQRALYDLAWPQQSWIEPADIPVKVFAGADDRLFPPPLAEETAHWHRGGLEVLPGTAHAMMLDVRWRECASRIAGWLDGLRD